MLTIIYNSILWNSSVCNATASRTLAKKKEIIGFIGHIFYPCNHQDIRRALINSQIDSIGLQFEEYLYISDHFETEHWFLTRTSGNLYEEYVLLAHVDGKIKQCEDLIGNNLIFYNSPRFSSKRKNSDSISRTSHEPFRPTSADHFPVGSPCGS